MAHRVERDCSEWAHEQIRTRLQGLKASRDGEADVSEESAPAVSVSIDSVSKVEGDVTVTQRKGRLRHNFDLNITFSWTSPISGEKGSVEIRDFMSDTDLKGFEFGVKSGNGSSSAVSLGVKSFLMSAVRDMVWAVLQEFAADLIDEHGKHLLVPQSGDSEGPNFKNAAHDSDVKRELESTPATSSVKRDDQLTSLNETVDFQAPASEVFLTLTSPDRVRIWSRGPLQGSLTTPGASFSLFSGAVTGTVEEVEEQRLKMSWRLASWPADILSRVNISVTDCGPGECRLKLEQTGVPAEQVDALRSNWTAYYWNPIKGSFGYGTILPSS